MDKRTGEILTAEEVQARIRANPQDERYFAPVRVGPTPLQSQQCKVGRNDPCPCGSGKKFKRCCLISAASPGDKSVVKKGFDHGKTESKDS